MVNVTSSHKVVLVDGSIGNYMSLNWLPNDDLYKKCWAASALINTNYHRLIVDVHKMYIEAGTNIIETNSYGVQPTYYKRVYGKDYKEKMLQDSKLAARLAVQARNESGRKGVRIVASIPPLTESFRSDLFFELLKTEGKEYIIETFRSLSKASLAGGADALIIENMVCFKLIFIISMLFRIINLFKYKRYH